MSSLTVSRTISAPVDLVFKTIAHIEEFSQAVPHIVKFEMLSDIRSGVGARFRETRLMNGRENTTELEVAEYVENDRVRMIADAGGTVWDTLFTVRPDDGGTELTVEMDCRPYKLVARFIVPLIRGRVATAVAKDMDAVKAFCESGV